MATRVHSKNLKIDLDSLNEKDLFQWFLACLLFGKPIQQEVAERTYFEFEKNKLLTPRKILEAGWDKLVKVLDDGHYVRYDFSTADKLLEICKELLDKYGSVTNVIKLSKDLKDLDGRLEEFKGIGPTTSEIFIREVGHVFNKIKEKERRVFVGIRVSAQTIKKIQRWKENYRDGHVRWIPNDNLHITILPPWKCEDIDKIVEKINKIKDQIIPFNLCFEKILFGPTERAPRLIWIEGQVPKELLDLKNVIEKALKVKKDNRKPRNHITIARFRPEEFNKIKIKKLEENINWEEKVQSIELMESILLPKGAVYQTLKKIKF